MGDYVALAHLILADPAYAGKTVLICWNHEEIPQLAALAREIEQADPGLNGDLSRRAVEQAGGQWVFVVVRRPRPALEWESPRAAG